MKEFSGRNVTIMSCSDCNTRCKHCYVSYKGNIDGDLLYDMCDKLKDKYQLNINGTEVLLHRGYFKTYDLIGQKRLLSNGIIINEDDSIIELIHNSSIEMVAMSYHFIIHEGISSVSQKMLRENILKLQENDIKVELMCTITKDNYDKVLELCENVVNMGVKKVRFINFLNTGNAINLDDSNILSDEQKNIFFKNLNKARSIYNKEQLLIKRCGSFGYDVSHKCNFKCPAGINKVVIAPDMNVYPCIYMVKPEYKIGKYIDGEVLIEQELCHNGMSCLANDCYNKGKSLVMKRI